MSKYRLLPTPAQEAVLRSHCAHARTRENLAVEQHACWRPGRADAPGYLEQCRQLTQARVEFAWLAGGSQTVQQQALRDFSQAVAAFFDPGNPALRITNMTRSAKGTREAPGRNIRQKSGLNRGILRSGWGLLVRRLEEKAPGRVVKVNAAFTSQRCSACGLVDAKSRKSQARFCCTACGYACHADVNAARNIAAGHAVTARGGVRRAGPANREPQLPLLPV